MRLARLFIMMVGRTFRQRPRLSVIVTLIALLVAWSWWPVPKPEYQMANVTRGDVERSVVSSGRLRPLQTVKIGAEASGLVSQVLVDVNDHVQQGQLLAELEPVRLDASVRQAEAQVALARANVIQAEAAITRGLTGVTDARRNNERLQQLYKRGFVAKRELENAETLNQRAVADVKGAGGQMASARAELARAEALLADARTVRARGRIISPIAGVVISRQVDPGQTLASNFQAPVLFEIATDLSHMRIEASINEADIGQVRVGQTVRFVIEAFPTRNFLGTVSQVRPQAIDAGNVISYTVIIEVFDKNARLLPGMSAHVEILTAIAKEAIRVPLSAIGFTPVLAGERWLIPKISSINVSVAPSGGGGNGPISTTREVRSSGAPADGRPTIWRADADAPGGLVAVPVKLGIRGDEMVQIVGGDVKVGDRIAIGRARSASY